MADEQTYISRDYRGTKGAIEDVETGANDKPAESSPPATTVRSNAVTSEQAKSTERTPEADEGTRAFGAPMGTPAPSTDRQRKGQTTDESQ